VSDHLEEVRQLLAKALDVSSEAIDPDANLFADFGFDSLGLFELMVTLEEAHGVRFNEADLHSLQTARLVAEYLERLIHDDAGAPGGVAPLKA
jgi:acyl carrier protein